MPPASSPCRGLVAPPTGAFLDTPGPGALYRALPWRPAGQSATVPVGTALSSTSMAKKKSGGGWLESVKTVLYAGLIAVGIRTVAFEPFNIPSGSMIPTLLVGDYLFVSKFSYGYSRYSLPFGPDLFEGRIFGRLPRRGDVAGVKLPRDPSQEYIKRVIRLPRDRIP